MQGIDKYINQIICGDALEVLKTLPDELVNCCVTSPPYWGLRDYGTATWEGGDKECSHCRDTKDAAANTGQRNVSGSIGDGIYKAVCKKCGAVRVDNQLGLEQTPEEYVSKMVEIFREVKRVLKDDGTVWLNLGDSYNGSGGPGSQWDNKNFKGIKSGEFKKYKNPNRKQEHLKPKDLCGIPWRVAFALQADGWYLRSDIIWSKPNPMPESVTDRPTKAHEYIFLLSKNAKYYYDADAIREPDNPDGRKDTVRKKTNRYTGNMLSDFQDMEHERWTGSRNKRSVWEVSTQPFPAAHFAVYPEELIKPCILAGCPERGIVLDPFMGSGTTALVARNLNRKYIGIELNQDYIKICEKRLAQMRLEL